MAQTNDVKKIKKQLDKTCNLFHNLHEFKQTEMMMDDIVRQFLELALKRHSKAEAIAACNCAFPFVHFETIDKLAEKLSIS